MKHSRIFRFFSIMIAMISILSGYASADEVNAATSGGRIDSISAAWEDAAVQGGVSFFSSTYTVYVGGTELTVSNDGTPAYLTNNGSAGNADNYNAKLWYDTTDSVLKLEINDLSVSGDSSYSGTDIMRCAGLATRSEMMLILKGENNIYGVKYDATKAASDSQAYGIYCSNLLITGDGTLNVKTADVDGSTYGIRSTSGVTIGSGTVRMSAGDSVNISRLWNQQSYGIYAYTVAIGGTNTSPLVEATAGESQGESCAIFGYAGISIRSGDVTAKAGYANRGYADGLLSNRSTIYIVGGKVTASSEGAYDGMSTGICANELEITGGEVRATGGLPRQGEQQSAGIYVNYDIDISGGTVYGTGLRDMGDVSFGINSWRGDITISGNAVVHAVGGPASYSVGLSAERGYYDDTYAGGDITIRDNAKVYASVSDDEAARVYSYGMFVGGNLLIEGNPYVEAVGGRVSEDWISGLVLKPPREKRSFGIYLADAIYDGTDTNYVEGGHKNTIERHTFHITGGTVIARTVETKNGTIEYSNQSHGDFKVFHRSYAVVLYDADRIAFADAKQTNEKWYQWKIGAGDSFIRSTDTVYPDADKWQSATQYFHVEPISQEPAPDLPAPDLPDTGDDSHIGLWILMMGASLVGMNTLLLHRKRKFNWKP